MIKLLLRSACLAHRPMSLPSTLPLTLVNAGLVSLVLVLGSASAQAQSGIALTPSAALSRTTVEADHIVALVNGDPITHNELRLRMRRVQTQFAGRPGGLPPEAELRPQVLEQLVMEQLQIQLASTIGLRVSEAELDAAERTVASNNQLSLEAFRERFLASGANLSGLRAELRQQLLIQALRERRLAASPQPSESEIDAIADRLRAESPNDGLQLNLGHVLVAVPENADPNEIQRLQARAEEALQKAREGADFAELARQYSDAIEARSGGQFGLRPVDRLPALFVAAVQPLQEGDLVGPLRSPAGFHVLKLLQRQSNDLAMLNPVQARASHILLRVGPARSNEAASAELARIRVQIEAGELDFEAAARLHSQDGSAEGGGDLGWANPGQYVPEFEAVMNVLEPGETSQPIVSRFGVHLIRMQERRSLQLSPRQQRERLRQLAGQEKAEAEWERWLEDERGAAFVEYREAPQ